MQVIQRGIDMNIIRLDPKSTRNLTVAVWDESAQVFEIFADRDCDSYIGCADTISEAKQIGVDWINED